VPDLEPELVRLLGLVALALFFESYDLSMLTSALKFIAEDLQMAGETLGGYMGMIRLGALPAFLLIPFADQVGRRRVFLVCVVGVSVGTFLTAFSQSPLQFVVIQMITRAFMIGGAAVAVVIVTEEFPARYRGWAIGMLGALAACGHGLGAALFAAIEVLPFGWRTLYLVGATPVLMLPLFQRGIRETSRFEQHQLARAQLGNAGFVLSAWYEPLLNLARKGRMRTLGLALAGGLFALGQVSVFQFTGYFTQTVHGWSPGQFSIMVIIGGGVGIIGNIVAGRLGDQMGRRHVGLVFMALFPVSAWIFYNGPGWTLPLAWTLFVFCSTAGDVIVRAFSTELFPTSHRGTSAGWLSLIQTVGWAGGLLLVGLGTNEPGDIARVTSLLSLAVLAAGLALLLLPETGGRELEMISGER
jgi:putative MFS transporter